jgi:Flp pilus assembly protein TadG
VSLRARSDERGSAIVEFTLVSVILVMLFLAILQLGLLLHVRNTLVASAAEGARYAANADRDLAAGESRTRQLIKFSVSDRYARNVSASYAQRAGVTLVEVRVRTTFPLVGLLGPPESLEVTGHAVEEAP